MALALALLGLLALYVFGLLLFAVVLGDWRDRHY